jgi:hypothetical protein
MKRISLVLSLIIMSISLSCIYSCDAIEERKEKKRIEAEQKQREAEEQEWKNKFSTVESTRANIENTVWTSRRSDRKWLKLEFKNGLAYLYIANASDGEWGEPTTHSYTIEEQRYSDTGKRYVGVFMGSIMQVLVPLEQEFHYLGLEYYMHPKDYQWE